MLQIKIERMIKSLSVTKKLVIADSPPLRHSDRREATTRVLITLDLNFNAMLTVLLIIKLRTKG